MTKFSEGIIGKIKCDHIAPVPRWHFLLKSYVFWGLLVVSLLLGSLSFSVIAHLISTGDLDVFSYLQGNVVTSTVMMLPYFWLLSLTVFALVAFYNWKHTKLGYKFKRRWIFVSSIGLSMFLGSILYVFGMGNEVDRIMTKAMPFYDQSKQKARSELWLQPENGLIIGKVMIVNSADKQLVIQDEQGNDWSIDEDVTAQKIEAAITKGKIIKIIGKKNGDRRFTAREIRRCGDCQEDEDGDKDNGGYAKTNAEKEREDNDNDVDDDDEENRSRNIGDENRDD
jgi:hypothetical protein